MTPALPAGHVFFVGFAAVSALAAYVAPSRSRALGVAAAMLATVPNEIPLVAVLLLAQASWIAATDDGLLDAPLGWLVLAVSLVTQLILLMLLGRGLRARGVVATAVGQALGREPAEHGTRPVWRTLLTPLPVRPWRVQRIGNLSYGPGGRRNRLDIYRRRSTPPDAPVLVYLHGGGYFSGSKRREARVLLHHFAVRGWVCVAATYRLRPAVAWPGHLIDAKRVLAWAREHAVRYGGDPSTLVLAGSSAGAHLTAVAALSANEPAFQPGFEDADTSITAAIGLYGYYGPYDGLDADERPSSSPLEYGATAAPPFFLAHGDHDTYTPVPLARALARHLRARSPNPVAYAELPGGQHGFDLLRSVRSDAVVAGIDAFLTGISNPTRGRTASNAPVTRGAAGTVSIGGDRNQGRVL